MVCWLVAAICQTPDDSRADATHLGQARNNRRGTDLARSFRAWRADNLS